MKLLSRPRALASITRTFTSSSSGSNEQQQRRLQRSKKSLSTSSKIVPPQRSSNGSSSSKSSSMKVQRTLTNSLPVFARASEFRGRIAVYDNDGGFLYEDIYRR